MLSIWTRLKICGLVQGELGNHQTYTDLILSIGYHAINALLNYHLFNSLPNDNLLD